MATNLTQPVAAPITSADEMKATLETFKELGSDYGDAVVESFVGRLGDQIDDRVAEAFDEKLAERMAQPGPLRSAATRDQRAGLVVLVSMLLGTLATILASGIAEVALAWVGLAAINLAYMSRKP
jgi:hypothetical protein